MATVEYEELDLPTPEVEKRHEDLKRVIEGDKYPVPEPASGPVAPWVR